MFARKAANSVALQISADEKTRVESDVESDRECTRGNWRRFREKETEGEGAIDVFLEGVHPLSQQLNIELCENCACIRIIQISQIKFARRFARVVGGN